MLVKQQMIIPLFILCSHTLMKVRENICYTLSNLFINGPPLIQIASEHLLDTKMLSFLQEKEHIDVQKEAVWALSTLLSNQSDQQKEEFLSNKEVVKILCEFTNKKYLQLNDEIISKLLECFIQILEFGEYCTRKDDAYQSNPYWIAIEMYETVNVFEQLSQSGNNSNAQQASVILEKYSWCNSNLSNQ